MRRIVIAGNGIAGLTAADTLRANGFDGDITIIGDEAHAAYSRPALSKALLRDHDDDSSHLLPPAEHGARERLGAAVTGVDVDRRVVIVDAHDEVPYDGLVIATGCRARRLGGRDSGELTLRTLDDAVRLRHRIAGASSVVVVGGGPLGMEIASGCREAGCEVTLVSRGVPLRTQLGEHLSAVFTTAARHHGLRVIETEGATVARHDGRTAVVLEGGTILHADVVVTAVGDVPNVDWLRDAGLAPGGVVTVDERGRVRSEIVAAGDVAAVPTALGVRRIPLWNSAIEQAQVAAATLLLGADAPALVHRPYFWTEQFGLSLKSVGDLPFVGEPERLDGDPDTDSALLRWDNPQGPAAAAVNFRMPIPRLRRLCASPQGAPVT